MTVLAANDVTKAYGERVLLEGASLVIGDGERVGVVGRNGVGKSTLARILAGVETPDTGSIAVRRGARVAFLAQEPALDPARSVRACVEEGLEAWLAAKTQHEEITHRIAESHTQAMLDEQLAAAAEVERLGGWDRSHEVERVLDKLGVLDVIDRAAGTLSGGQKRRVALAKVLVGAPDVMLLDEPTNHLDADTIDWLERHLAEDFRGAVLLVTHDRWLLDRVADRTIEVDGGKIYSYDGGYADYLAAKAERLAIVARTEKNRQNFLRTELEWLRRQPKARTTKQKARIDRAEAAKSVQAPRDDARVALAAQVTDAGRSVLDLRGLSLRVPNGERVLVKGLDLAMTTGDRLGVVGPNGAGKTTLLRAIAGELAAASGEIVLGRRVRIGYLDQQRQSLEGDLSVLECVAKAVPSVEGERVDPRTYLERFAFEGNAQKKKVAALSGGERARLALARLLATAANLLLLDEPSNDLDTDTLSALEDFLSTYEGSLLVVTHDRYLLDRVTTGILCFEGDGRVTRYAGAYQAYAAARAREDEERRAARSASKEAKPRERPRAAGLSKNEQRELDGILDAIDAAERRAAAIEAELGDPTLYVGGVEDARVAAIRTRLEEARAAAAKLTARWEQLEAKKADA
ncbi:MAG TPA: ABC-F family ATP-binding cassette domain-containing protein [Labilithrix sp.]|jgi:ATP-binding cassette subfamily F protein uup